MQTVWLKALMCVWGIFWNVLIVAAILRDRVLRNSSTFLLLSLHFVACTVDVGSRLVFDVPSEILNRPLFRLSVNYDDFPTKLFHYTTYTCWFIQLYSLIAIAASHILAVYGTIYYSRFNQKKTVLLILVVVVMSMTSVCYLWGDFPIVFHEEFWGWTEDRDKPFVQFFFYLNYVVQGIVFFCLALTDILIVYKLSTIKESVFSNERSATIAPTQLEKMQVSVVNSGNSTSTSKRSSMRVSTELKVSINFIIVSLFLLIQTLIYNICTLYDNPLSLFLLFIAPIFRGSKCLAYLVSGSALRNAIMNMILFRKQF